MRSRSALFALILLVLVPATAVAGGWATVEMSSTPAGTVAGKPWVVDLDIRQHGVTPVEGVHPSIVVTDQRTGAKRTAWAGPTSTPGVYRARVVFPSAGEYEYVVNDGFSRPHTYPPVRVKAAGAAATPAPPSEGFPWTAFLASLAAGAIAAGATAALQRRRPRAVLPEGGS